MNSSSMLSRVKTLEFRLKVFQKELESIKQEILKESDHQKRYFGELYGILKGVHTSEEEIEDVKRQWEPKPLS